MYLVWHTTSSCYKLTFTPPASLHFVQTLIVVAPSLSTSGTVESLEALRLKRTLYPCVYCSTDSPLARVFRNRKTTGRRRETLLPRSSRRYGEISTQVVLCRPWCLGGESLVSVFVTQRNLINRNNKLLPTSRRSGRPRASVCLQGASDNDHHPPEVFGRRQYIL